MTREAIVAMFAFALTLLGLVLQSIVILAFATIAGAAFLFCQDQMLHAAKGIPA